jgi:hypothetical protein
LQGVSQCHALHDWDDIEQFEHQLVGDISYILPLYNFIHVVENGKRV